MGVAAASAAEGSSVRAMRLFDAKPYTGDTVLFVAREHPQTGSPLDRRLGWLHYVSPRPEVIHVESGHLNLFDGARAAELSAVCRERLPRRGFDAVAKRPEAAPVHLPGIGVPA